MSWYRSRFVQESILDVPPSWVRKLTLDRDLAALRYPPRGHRTILYRRAKVELFAENVHDEGTTLRLTLYKVIALFVDPGQKTNDKCAGDLGVPGVEQRGGLT